MLLARLFTALAAATTLLAQEPELVPPTPAELSQAREQEAYAIGTQAYVYGLPFVNMYWKRQEHLQKTPVNQFRHLRDVVTPDMGMVAPNLDVLYSLAWLDLSREPVVLSIPNSKDRYVSFQAVEFSTDNSSYFSSRTEAEQFRQCAYVGPNWDGKLPAGLQRLDCSTSAIGLIGRTFVRGTADVVVARALQDQYTLTPLSHWNKAPHPPVTPPVYPAFDQSEPLNFFAAMDEALRQNPPPQREAGALEMFKEIGIGTGSPFRVEALDAATRAGLTRALEAGQQIVTTRAKQLHESIGGWVLAPANTGRYGTNYMLRAAAASLRLGINSPRECFYLSASVDQDKQPLQAGNRYRLRFAKGQLPPVDAFWSLTMYQLPERVLAGDSLERLRLNSVVSGLKYRADGSLDLLFQKDLPAPPEESNWLPTPDGKFRIVMRLYEPALSVIKHQWTPPVVERLP